MLKFLRRSREPNTEQSPPLPRESQPALDPAPNPPPANLAASAGFRNNTTPAVDDDFWSIDETAILHPPSGAFYELSVDLFFNARHYVVMEGRIGPAHDHSYRLQVRCRSRTLEQDDHIVIGYQVLRDPMKLVLQAYNNRLLNDLPPFRRLQPTTENLAAVLFQQLQRMLTEVPIELISVTLWESPTEAVTYRIDPKVINDPSVQSSNGEELRSVCVAPSSSQRG